MIHGINKPGQFLTDQFVRAFCAEHFSARRIHENNFEIPVNINGIRTYLDQAPIPFFTPAQGVFSDNPVRNIKSQRKASDNCAVRPQLRHQSRLDMVLFARGHFKHVAVRNHLATINPIDTLAKNRIRRRIDNVFNQPADNSICRKTEPSFIRFVDVSISQLGIDKSNQGRRCIERIVNHLRRYSTGRNGDIRPCPFEYLSPGLLRAQIPQFRDQFLSGLFVIAFTVGANCHF